MAYPASPSSGKSMRERLADRFCRQSCEAESVSSYDLVLGFLSGARRDGYISSEEHKELVTLVGEVSSSNDSEGSRRTSDQNLQLLEGGDEMARQMLNTMGLANRQEFSAPKVRGNIQQDDLVLPKSEEDCEELLRSKDFDCRQRGDISQDAALVLYGFTHPVNYIGRYSMDSGKLDAWIRAIAKLYTPDMAYHNWKHAMDVFQYTFMMIRSGDLASYLNYQDACSLLIAALAHDVGHPGTNNAFLQKSRSPLTIRYNDRSPLENMHASLTFETLQKPDSNFLEKFASDDFDNIRKKIIDAILETDPSLHFGYTAKLDARVSSIQKYEEAKDEDQKKANLEDRRLLLQGVVHMADIGNGFRPWNVYKHVVVLLESEFFDQGDRERNLGLPISPLMDRSKDSLAAGQDFFLSKLVLPLFDVYGRIMDNAFTAEMKDTLEDNKKRWNDLIEKHGKKTAKELIAILDASDMER